ncbi:hypothetical protein DUNSADRAFT_13487 [Dunaliella salina]|uniref:Ribonuclease P/MRP protein subunit POP5 n=1 Tax=Dunaliella salina TaxID=3046 RepID=A0ABQ7G9D5_DUNSA|nr:hypothetical protein DUNSADRAFT_13487 [Dunaliella salina]|eukprot:KAF5831184.1 hypothetical protein DUNSADRAFT_13487 [Dunaliella salina]
MVRFKNRYLLVRLNWKDRAAEGLNELGLVKALRDSLEVQFGDVGLGSSFQSLQVKWYSPFSRLGVVRCDREACKQVCSSIAQLKDINFRKVVVEPLHVCGTMQACQRHTQRLNTVDLKSLLPHQRQAAALLDERLRTMEL